MDGYCIKMSNFHLAVIRAPHQTLAVTYVFYFHSVTNP